MKIYTKGGDKGQTSLFGGQRVPKDALRIEAYGTLDELNAILGLMIAGFGPAMQEIRENALRVQGELFQLGAELATPSERKVSIPLIEDSHIEQLEREIDHMETFCEPLKTFILPGGGRLSAKAHFARTVSRRAERKIISLHHQEPVREEIIRYINRLSDHLFVLARYLNHIEQIRDVPWHMRAKS